MSKLDYGNAPLAGLPSRYINHLLCVIHTATRLVFSARKTDHVTPVTPHPLLHELHRLHVPERIIYKLATLVFRCLHGIALPYLENERHRVMDIEGRQRLRSTSTVALVILPARLPTVGDRALPVAASRVWNNLPPHVRLACHHHYRHLRADSKQHLQSFVSTTFYSTVFFFYHLTRTCRFILLNVFMQFTRGRINTFITTSTLMLFTFLIIIKHHLCVES